MSCPPEHIYLSLAQALELAHQPNWSAIIQAISQLTGQPEQVVADAVAPLIQLGPSVAVARSMPTATCEHWLLTQLAARHQLMPVQWSMAQDRYMDFNPEKRLMIRHKVIYEHIGLNGRRVRDQQLSTRQFQLNGIPMDQIEVRYDGGFLPRDQYHRQWWQSLELGGAEVNASLIAHQILGEEVRKELWYPVFFLLMSASLIILENYSPRYCKDLWPVVAEVWQQTRQQGFQPRLVRLPLTPEIDWFLERPGLEPPPQVQRLLDQFV